MATAVTRNPLAIQRLDHDPLFMLQDRPKEAGGQPEPASISDNHVAKRRGQLRDEGSPLGQTYPFHHSHQCILHICCRRADLGGRHTAKQGDSRQQQHHAATHGAAAADRVTCSHHPCRQPGKCYTGCRGRALHTAIRTCSSPAPAAVSCHQPCPAPSGGASLTTSRSSLWRSSSGRELTLRPSMCKTSQHT